MFRCYVAFLVTGFWSTLMHESCHINKKKLFQLICWVWGTFHLFNHNSSFYTCIKNSVLNQVTWQNENTAIPYLGLTPAAPPPLYVLSHWWPCHQIHPCSIRRCQMLLANMEFHIQAVRTDISALVHARSSCRFVMHHWGFCVQARDWEREKREGGVVMVCVRVCVSSYMGNWQESLKSCQQLNL